MAKKSKPTQQAAPAPSNQPEVIKAEPVAAGMTALERRRRDSLLVADDEQAKAGGERRSSRLLGGTY